MGYGRPFLLYLGSLHPRKNVPEAIAAFRAAQLERPELRRHGFVIAGQAWFGSTAETEAAAGAAPRSILFLDWVSDAEREVLLTDAEALVYLSRFEGFGLPPLEAMIRGTAVLASTATSIPEVCGDAALLVDPDESVAVRAALTRILSDADLRTELRARGTARAATFSDRATAVALQAALARTTGLTFGASMPAARPS